jgi:hypothetical protein
MVRDYDFVEGLMNELEEYINNLDIYNKDLQEVYDRIFQTESIMVGSLLKKHDERKISQIERMQALRKRVGRMLVDASNL